MHIALSFLKLIFLIVLVNIIVYYIYNNNNKLEKKCNVKNILKKNIKNVWNVGNFIDLGANDGDSVLWFYNINMSNIKYTVPYPKILIDISKNFNSYIFEANPSLCNKIQEVVNYISKYKKLRIIKLFCPVIVSTYDGTAVMSIDKEDDSASSIFYKSNSLYNSNRNNITLPVINITKFILNNIPYNDFNVMKFDVEGEEHKIIPDLIKMNQLIKFDVLYSEFHKGNINNPFKEKALNIYNSFINFTKNNGIDAFEERKISKIQKRNYMNIYNDLYFCRKELYF